MLGIRFPISLGSLLTLYKVARVCEGDIHLRAHAGTQRLTL